MWEIFLTVMLVSLSAGTGRFLLRWIKIDQRTGLGTEGRLIETVLWSVGVGFIPLALGLLLLGALGFFSPMGIALFTLLWAVLGAGEWRVALARCRMGPWFNFDCSTMGWELWVLATGALFGGFLAAMSPPTYYDSLVYHLALPLRYLQEGRIGFVPYNQYAHFPQNMEMIYAWFLSAGSDISAQLFNLLLGVLTGVMLWTMGRREDKRRWDLLLYVTAPCVVLLSSETYVEMPMAFFTTLAVWGADRGLRDRNRSWLVLSGLAGGFAFGIKYWGGITPFLLTTLLLCWPGRRSVRERFWDGVCLGGTSFVLFLPWMVKNIVLTGGNPVFPFLPSLFPAPHVYKFEEASRAFFQVMAEYQGTQSLWRELLAMPYRLIVNAQSFGQGYDVVGTFGWTLPLVLAPLMFLPAIPRWEQGVRRWSDGQDFPSGEISKLTQERGRGFLLVYVVLHVLLWGALGPVLRYLFPVFPLICLLAGEGAGILWKGNSIWTQRAMVLVGCLFFISNGTHLYLFETVRDPLPVALGVMSRTDYLSKKLDYYPAMEFMNKSLPSDANVLFVGDQRSYYCPRRHLAPMGLLPTPLRDWTNDAADGAAFGRKLRELGFTHLFFNFKEAKRIEGYRVLDFTDHGREVFNSYLRSLTPIYTTEGTVLFSLPYK